MSTKLVDLTKETAPKKFAVVVKDSGALSEQVQKYLFEHLDAAWYASENPKVTKQYLGAEVLFVEYNERRARYEISYADEAYYNSQKLEYPPIYMNAEIKVTLKSMKLDAEVVEINGKTYLKAQVEKALEGLEV